MNLKFYELPPDKQSRIIQAGLIAFSKNGFKQCPTLEIANAANISKSLLFHYFHNKKELYLFLWKQCVQIINTYLDTYFCFDATDLITLFTQWKLARAQLLKEHPEITGFVLNAFCEKDEFLSSEIYKIYQQDFKWKLLNTFKKIRPDTLKSGINVETMHLEMHWAFIGYLWETSQIQNLDPQSSYEVFLRLVDFWTLIYVNHDNEL